MNILHVLRREFGRALPPTLFFLISFHIGVLIRHLDEEGYGITPGRSMMATISALVLGKLYLLLDERRLANLFADRPLILAVLWKTLLYGGLASLAIVAEDVLPPIVREHASPGTAWRQYTAAIVWPLFWSNHLFMALTVFAFSTASELARVIGRRQILALFFGPRRAGHAPPAAPARDPFQASAGIAADAPRPPGRQPRRP